jgi:PleD family two-component response regulator
VDSGPVRITASVGVASWERETVDEVLGRADHALYEAKAAGRDQVVAAPSLGPVVPVA